MSASDDIHLIPDLSLIKYRYLLGCSEYKNKDVAKKSLFLAIEDKGTVSFSDFQISLPIFYRHEKLLP